MNTKDFKRKLTAVFSADVVIDINGRRYSSRQPFRLQREKEIVTVKGFVLLRQTDLGLQPFSALGGGLRMADTLEIHSPSPGCPVRQHGEDRPSPRLRPDKMATGDRGVARRAKTGGFVAVPLGFATDAPRGSAGSFTSVSLPRCRTEQTTA